MNRKNIVVLLVALIVLVGAGAGFYFLILPKMSEEKPEVRSAYSPGDYFVTNIKDSKSYVKVSIALEVNRAADDGEFQEFMKSKNHIIRDAIVFVLREKTYEELSSPDVKEILSQELIDKINEALGTDNVVGIYYNDYVVQ